MLHDLTEKDYPYKTIIDLIHQFPLSTQFFQWLLNDELVIHILLEKVHNNLFERIAEYKYGDKRVFSIGGQFKLNEISKEFFDALIEERHSFYNLIPYLERLEKREIAQSSEGANYTVISQFYDKSRLCGGGWEIYDLNALLQIYNSRKASLVF